MAYKVEVYKSKVLDSLKKFEGLGPTILRQTDTIIGLEYSNYQKYLAQLQKKEEEERKKPKFSSVSQKNIPIIMYHHIHPEYVNSSDALLAGLTVSPKRFEKDLQDIISKGYITIFPNQIFDVLEGKLDPSKKYIVLSIDDGYRDNYEYAFPLLKKYNLKAVIYIIANNVGKKMGGNDYFGWEEAKEMLDSNLVMIGSHTMDHPDLSKLNEEQLTYQIIHSKKVIDENLKISITDFCYPYGKYSDLAIEIVKRAGYSNATTVAYGQLREKDTNLLWPRFRTSETYPINNYL